MNNYINIKKLSFASLIYTFLSASVAFAAPKNFQELVQQANGLINGGTTVLITAALAIFLWSIFKNMKGIDDQNGEQKKKLQDSIMWGIIVLFVMVSIGGIVAIIKNTLLHGL